MGDAAVADVAIAGIRRNIPGVEIWGICQQPENVEQRHGIKAFSIFRTFIRQPAQASAAPPIAEISNSIPVVEDAPKQPSIKTRIKNLIKSSAFLFALLKSAQNLKQQLPYIFYELQYTRSIYAVVKQLDLLVMAGSGQLNEDWGGPWRYPFALFRWCLLARLAGCKVAFLSVGAGSVTSFLGRFFCASALRLAHYKSIRDAASRRMVEGWGVKGARSVPDMAFLIQFEAGKKLTGISARPVVGINPIAYCDPRSWHESDIGKYQTYIAKLASFCEWLLREGYAVHFIPNELRMDNLVIDDVVARLDPEFARSAHLLRPETKTSEDVGNNLAQCDYVVASRFHGLLFSFLSRRPVITLAFHFKFVKLAEEMGQEHYCLDIAEFQLPQLQALFLDLARNKDHVSAVIAGRTSGYPEMIEQQFRALRELIG